MSTTTPAGRGGPPQKEDLTLVAMPLEILTAIIRTAVENEAEVSCCAFDRERGHVVWNSSWLLSLLLVSKEFSRLAKRILVEESKLIAHHPSNGRRLLFHLDGIPKSILEGSQYLEFQQTGLGYLMFSLADFDAGALPRLRELVFTLRPLRQILQDFVLAERSVSRWIFGTEVANTFRQKIACWSCILTDSKTVSEAEGKEMVDGIGDSRARNPNDPDPLILYHAPVIRRLQMGSESISRLFSGICYQMLEITRGRVKNLEDRTLVKIIFPTSQNSSESIITVSISKNGPEEIDINKVLVDKLIEELKTDLEEYR